MDEERLIVNLEARVNEFEKRMKKAERTGTRSYQNLRRDSRRATNAMERDMVRSTNRINQALASTSSRIGSFGKAFAAGAIASGVAAFTAGIGRAVSSMAELGAEARRAGVNVEDFQEWKYVAEQNRIGIDAMVDGLKELNLRADEFVVTGQGPAAEAFQRMGYGAEDLKRRLEDPSELLLDIIRRMEDLDRAARLRVADEVFGGTAGEQFVQLLDRGSAGIRELKQEAREAGTVMDAEVVESAEEIDRKFTQIRARAARMFKEFVVGSVEFSGEVANLRAELDDMFRSYDQARGLLGDDTASTLRDDAGAAAEHAETLGRIRRQYENVADATGRAIPQLQQAANLMLALGYPEAAAELAHVSTEMRELSSGMKDGSVDAETFETRMDELTTSAQESFSALMDIDRVQFSGAMSAVDGLIGRLASAAQAARELRSSIPGSGSTGADGNGKVYSGRGGDPRDLGGSAADWNSRSATDEAPGTSPRPPSRPNDIDFGYYPEDTETGGGGSSGGGGGTERLSEYQQMVQDTRQDVTRLQAEATALVAVAQSGRDVGDAVDFARRKAELLYAAQEDGREITPELMAEIDDLALSYTKAGQEAETAADRLDLIQQHAERGANAMADLFGSIFDGSMSAKDAVGQLLQQIARVQMQKGFASLADTGGALGWLGGLLSGGRAGGGPVRGGSAYMVNENTPNSEVFVPSQSGGVLNVPQAQAALRGSAQATQSGENGTSGRVELIVHAGDGVTVQEMVNTIDARIMQAGSKIKSDLQRSMRHGSKKTWGI